MLISHRKRGLNMKWRLGGTDFARITSIFGITVLKLTKSNWSHKFPRPVTTSPFLAWSISAISNDSKRPCYYFWRFLKDFAKIWKTNNLLQNATILKGIQSDFEIMLCDFQRILVRLKNCWTIRNAQGTICSKAKLWLRNDLRDFVCKDWKWILILWTINELFALILKWVSVIDLPGLGLVLEVTLSSFWEKYLMNEFSHECKNESEIWGGQGWCIR